MVAEKAPEYAAFEELEIGISMGPINQVIDTDMVKRYADAIGSKNSWFHQNSPFGTPIVPPTILENLALRLPNTAIKFQTKGGGLHAQMESEYLKPVAVGSKVRVVGHLADKYIRRDKFYLVTEFHVYNDSDEEVLKGRIIQARLPDPAQAKWL